MRGKPRTGFLPAVDPGKTGRFESQGGVLAAASTHDREPGRPGSGDQPVLRGWLNYFTVFYPSAVNPVGKRIDRHLMRWAKWKYKRLKRSDDRARSWLRGVRQRSPDLFAHWKLRYTT